MPPARFRSLVRRPLGAAAIVLAATLAGPSVTAGGGETTLKAAFLYNFALYTEWPALGASFEICVLGGDALDDALGALSAKAIAGRPIRVRRLVGTAVPDDCNVLFVAASDNGRVAGLLAALASRPLLTVADHGAETGGKPMLRLVLDEGRLAFDAHPNAAHAAGLRFSAKLLRLARRID